MTETQFAELMARLDNFQLMVFLGICVLLVALGWMVGGQR